MNFKKLLVCAGLVGVSAFGVGCGGDDTTPATPDGGGPVCNAAALATGTTHTYVINLLSIAGPEGDAAPFTSAGYNVDHDAVVACNSHVVGETAEFNGQAPDNGSGIDNALGGDLGGLANDSLQGSLDDGSVLLVVEVRGVDDTTNDSCVGVTFYIGKLQPGVTAPMVDGMGHLVAGQTFDVTTDSFVDGAGGMNPAIRFDSSRIVAGRLQAGPANFPLALNLLGASLALTIKEAQIRFDISHETISAGRPRRLPQHAGSHRHRQRHPEPRDVRGRRRQHADQPRRHRRERQRGQLRGRLDRAQAQRRHGDPRQRRRPLT